MNEESLLLYTWSILGQFFSCEFFFLPSHTPVNKNILTYQVLRSTTTYYSKNEASTSTITSAAADIHERKKKWGRRTEEHMKFVTDEFTTSRRKENSINQ
jgi:hypothetical protein